MSIPTTSSATHSAGGTPPLGLPPMPTAPTSSHSADSPVVGVDRRSRGGTAPARTGERRQFGSSHSGLSANGRELALAIDAYKLHHHRRYITCDEMLVVLTQLGYQKQS